MFEKNSDFRKGCARLILQTTPENREGAKTIVSLLSKTDRNNITISLQRQDWRHTETIRRRCLLP